MSENILILVPYSQTRDSRIRALLPDREILYPFSAPAPEELPHLLKDAEIIFGTPDLPLLSDAPNLRWIQSPWAGNDRYTDYPEAFPEHVVLTNVKGVYGKTIAEHLLSMILALCRRLPDYHRNRTEKIWKDLGSEKLLYGGTALVLGTGDLGTETARRLKGFGMYVIGLSRTAHALPSCFDRQILMRDLGQVLPSADVVAGCLPACPETKHILDRRRLLMMKPDAVLVNAGRGSLIVTSDLEEVIARGHLWGAGLDVTDPEPLPASSPLWNADNVILTPHVAGKGFGHLSSVEEEIWAQFERNLMHYQKGEPLENIVRVHETILTV